MIEKLAHLNSIRSIAQVEGRSQFRGTRFVRLSVSEIGQFEVTHV